MTPGPGSPEHAALTGEPGRLLLDEDFSAGIDPRVWKPLSGPIGAAPECTADPDCVELADGELRLHVRTAADGSWRSGGLATWPLAEAGDRGIALTYGRVDVRVRTDRRAGVRVALLLWPDRNVSWPPEIDFYEIFEDDPDRTRARCTTWDRGPDGEPRVDYAEAHGDFTGWHTASVRWTPERIAYLTDDVVVHTVEDPARIPALPMWLGMQAHAHRVDGSMPSPSEPTVAMRVDHVRIWSYDALGGS